MKKKILISVTTHDKYFPLFEQVWEKLKKLEIPTDCQVDFVVMTDSINIITKKFQDYIDKEQINNQKVVVDMSEFKDSDYVDKESNFTQEQVYRVWHVKESGRQIAVNEEYDYFLQVDGDILVPEDALVKLISEDKDAIIGWTYNKKVGGLMVGGKKISAGLVFEVPRPASYCLLEKRKVFENIPYSQWEEGFMRTDDDKRSRDIGMSEFKTFLHSGVFCEHLLDNGEKYIPTTDKITITNKETFLNNFKNKIVKKEDIAEKISGKKLTLKKWNDTQLEIEFLGDEDCHLYPAETKVIGFEKWYEPYALCKEGGFEYEVVLSEKPNSNLFRFKITAPDLDFLYQPFLSKEEKYKMDIQCGMFRPPHIEGSLAVYHKTKSGGKYKTGKFCDIYGPKIKDANDKEVRGALKYENGILSVEVPQEFLDNAVYPVIIDPTFGYTSAGSTGSSYLYSSPLFRSYIVGSYFSGKAGDGKSITAYIKSGSGNHQLIYLVYKESDLSYVDKTEIRRGDMKEDEADWCTINFAEDAVLENIDYFLCAFVDHGGYSDCEIYYDEGSTNQGIIEQDDWETTPVFPDTLDPDEYNDNKYSIYCTYETEDGDLLIDEVEQLNITENVQISIEPAEIEISDQINSEDNLIDIEREKEEPEADVNVSNQLNLTENVSILLEVEDIVISDSLNVVENFDTNLEREDIDLHNQLNVTDDVVSVVVEQKDLSISDQLEVTELVHVFVTDWNIYTVKSPPNDCFLEQPSTRSIARAKDGTLYATYNRYDGSHWQILLSTSTDNGQTWSDEAMTTSNDDQYCPRVAVNSNDDLILIWEGKDWGTYPARKQNLYRKKANGSWGDIELITDGDIESVVPNFVIDSSDNVHVVWYNSENKLIYRQRTDSWQTEEEIFSQTPVTDGAILAADSNDNIHVVWYDYYSRIRYRKRNADTDEWDSLETPIDDGVMPSIVIDSSNDVWICFKGVASADDRNQKLFIKKKTDIWQNEIEVHHHAGEYPQSTNLAMDQSDNLHIFWHQRPLGGVKHNILYKKYDGSSFGNLEFITNDIIYNQRDPFSLWAKFPFVHNVFSSIPIVGSCLIYRHTDANGDGITFAKRNDLSWDDALTISEFDSLSIVEDTEITGEDLNISISENVAVSEYAAVFLLEVPELSIATFSKLEISSDIDVLPLNIEIGLFSQLSLTESILLTSLENTISTVDDLSVVEEIIISRESFLETFDSISIEEDISVSIIEATPRNIDVSTSFNLEEDLTVNLSVLEIVASTEISIAEDLSLFPDLKVISSDQLNIIEDASLSEPTVDLYIEKIIVNRKTVKIYTP